MKQALTFFFLVGICLQAKTQSYFFRRNNSVPVTINDKILTNPWTGGLNAVSVNSLDLNGDKKEDLVIFDKTVNKAFTFIASSIDGKSFYKHEAKYESHLPSLSGWVSFSDYNCDGLKDIFASSANDVKVYVNNTRTGQPLNFRLIKSPLNTEGLSGLISLRISSADLPAITDVDGDGDLDILTFESSSGSFVEFHKNLSKEKFGHCDSLDFKRMGNCWGNFAEGNTCRDFQFGVDCTSGSQMRLSHSGSSMLALDIDGDEDKDLLVGDVGCEDLILLRNGGTKELANFTSSTDTFPNSNQPAKIPIFPASFFEDVDFDGVKDLVVSPNLNSNDLNLSPFDKSILFFKNLSTNSKPIFSKVQSNFLQDEMIDLGEYSYPALGDVDGDGDFDLIAGSRGKMNGEGKFFASLHLFENTGSRESPSFKLVNQDYLGFSSYLYTNLKPQFLDIDKDGKSDLVYTATLPGRAVANIYYVLNTGLSGIKLELGSAIKLNLTMNDYDSPSFTDMDNDGDLDLLVGKNQGRLEYFKNNGNDVVPDYTLISNRVGGISNSITERNAFPHIGDLDFDGKKELIVTDKFGNFKIFADWKNSWESTFTNSSEFLFNENTKKFESYNFGREVFPTAGDLNNDGAEDLVLGTVTGGLIILYNEVRVNGIEKETSKIVSIYPNPASSSLFIESQIEGNVKIYSSLGEELQNIKLQRGKSELNISSFKKGVYLFSVENKRKIYSKKIIIE